MSPVERHLARPPLLHRIVLASALTLLAVAMLPAVVVTGLFSGTVHQDCHYLLYRCRREYRSGLALPW